MKRHQVARKVYHNEWGNFVDGFITAIPYKHHSNSSHWLVEIMQSTPVKETVDYKFDIIKGIVTESASDAAFKAINQFKKKQKEKYVSD